MAESFLQKAFAQRIGGEQFGKDTKIYKFEKIKRAKREAMAKNPGMKLIDMGVGEPDDMAFPAVVKKMQEECAKWENRIYADNGVPEFRQAAARYMKALYGVELDPETEICHAIGSKSALTLLPACFINPGDITIITIPGYPVLGTWTEYLGGEMVKLPLLEENDYLPDLESLTEDQRKRAKLLYLNYPNNPTGVVYSDATLKEIARILTAKEEEFGTDIYLISDEPYRELVYDGVQENFLTKYYKDTLVGYSFSKSLSLPGERIGYVVVPDEAADSAELIEGITVSNRTLGFVNAPSLIQKAVAECLKEKTNLEFYDRNRIALYEGLTKLGFTCIKPQGAFYLWLKSPVAKEEEFVEAAKKYHLILVKGSAFGYGGYVRLAYCTSYETVVNSMQAFAKLAAEYGLKAAE